MSSRSQGGKQSGDLSLPSALQKLRRQRGEGWRKRRLEEAAFERLAGAGRSTALHRPLGAAARLNNRPCDGSKAGAPKGRGAGAHAARRRAPAAAAAAAAHSVNLAHSAGTSWVVGTLSQ